MILPVAVRDRLRAHQIEPAEQLLDILKSSRTAVDFSDTGTGKTYVAAAVAKCLQLPTLVVVPKVAMTQWHRAAEHFGDSISVINYEMLRTGRTPFGRWDNNPPPGFTHSEYYQCISCQCKIDFNDFHPCYCHPQGIHCVEIKHKPWKYGKFNFHPGVRFAIFDEGHRCGGLDSLNADMMIAARGQVHRSLALTATPAVDPTKMRALGYFLDLHTLEHDILTSTKPRFYTWASKYGVRKEPMRGLQWRVAAEKQKLIMAEIRGSIIPARGVRVCVEDIPGFPEREIVSELYDLDENGEIDRLYDEMAAALERLELRASGDADPGHPLTMALRARQRIELLKTPIGVELARDYVDKGYQVAIFVNFTQTLEEMCLRLATKCCIRGGQKQSDRDKNIEDFQRARSPYIVVNNEAGGIAVSLHGQRRVGLVYPPEKAITLKQVFGRLHRDGGGNCHYRILFAAKTVETRVHRNLQNRLNNLDALTDADLNPCNLILTKHEKSHTTYS
jgi:Mimiviridae putative ATP-dependent RNA helicase